MHPAMKQLLLAVMVTGCGANTIVEAERSDSGTTVSDSETGIAAEPFAKFYNVKSLTYEGEYVVIRTTDVPDHKSPFFPVGDPQYEAYNGTNPSFSTTVRGVYNATLPAEAVRIIGDTRTLLR